MDALTVFLAPDGPAGGVRDVLRDLSTAGLVEPFLWIREAAVVDTLDGGGRIRAVEVAGGRLAETTLMAAVTGGHHRLVRLCSIIVLSGGTAYAESPAEPELATRLRAAAGRATVVQVRCLLAAPGDTAPARVLGRDGWHNVLVSPEDARGPDQAHELLPRATGPVELARHAGPVVAGLLGLWTGMTASCLDERAVPPQQQVRLVRGFYRNVDAAELESRLRERTFSTTTTPLPLEHGAAAVHVPDPPAACDTMVEALVRAHPELLPRPRRRGSPRAGGADRVARVAALVLRVRVGRPARQPGGVVPREEAPGRGQGRHSGADERVRRLAGGLPGDRQPHGPRRAARGVVRPAAGLGRGRRTLAAAPAVRAARPVARVARLRGRRPDAARRRGPRQQDAGDPRREPAGGAASR